MICGFVCVCRNETTVYIRILEKEGKSNKNNKDVCIKKTNFVIHYFINSLKEFISR